MTVHYQVLRGAGIVVDAEAPWPDPAADWPLATASGWLPQTTSNVQSKTELVSLMC